MGGKYEKYYQTGRGICGEPFVEFVDYFQGLGESPLEILDLGCGQGRDALVLARLGHRVLGVDISPTGIAQMVADAEAEGLSVQGVVADIVAFAPGQQYDVVVLDRVLHMLAEMETRLEMLGKVLGWVKPAGHILLADTTKNTDQFHQLFKEAQQSWTILKRKKGFLFVQRLKPDALAD